MVSFSITHRPQNGCNGMNAERLSRKLLKGVAGLTVIGGLLSAATSRGEEFYWPESAIDTWSYSQGFGGGTRLLAPSFGSLFLNDEDDGFDQGSSFSPTRLGSMLVAFETMDQVTPLLAASRYAIQSASVTVKLQSGSTGSLLYTDTPDTIADLVAEAQSGGVSTQRPMELFGVGFRGGYEGFALGANQTGTRFAESTPVHSSAAGGYVAYPVVGGDSDDYMDVSNNLSGGFSATTGTSSTAAFDATPWSIGTTGLNTGDAIPNDTTFTFDIDLSQPGVLAYLQQSLSQGSLGFFISSVHPASQPGTGSSGAYPQWYTKESIGIYPNGESPTLSIDVTILPLAGDYNADGEITELDYEAWVVAYGSSVSIPGAGADGNADGIVNAADYTVWRDAMSAAPMMSIPEPSACFLAFAAVANLSLRNQRRML